MTLRFSGYSGPSDLLAVLVREGDLAAKSVPILTLARGAGVVEGSAADVTVGQVHALSALTDVWRVRLAATSGLARLEEGEEVEGVPVGVDAELVRAVEALRRLEETARGRLARRPSAPAARRLGSGADLVAARRAMEARRALQQATERLWPLPERVPVMHHMRRFLSGLRQRVRVRLVAEGATTGETVAATLAALELVRRGRARLWQRRAYAPVTVVRPSRAGGREARG